MKQASLFQPPDIFSNRLQELTEDLGLSREQAEILLQVELGFALMERLKLDDEPVTAVWAILSGMPLRYPRLQNLDETERQAIANARQIIPFSARFSWLTALRSYISIPIDWRNYNINNQDFDTQIINATKQIRQPNHQIIYDNCLSNNLKFCQRRVKQVEPKVAYKFDARTETETTEMRVQFTEEDLTKASQLNLPWFSPPVSRNPFSLSISDLEEDAKFLDKRENDLADQYGWNQIEKGNWVKRFHKINFHTVQENGELSKKNQQQLKLDGFVHVAGMVASGKSTLSLLLATHILRQHPELRITLVVSDTQSAIRMANQINWWFCNSPENDVPVAVPLLGRTKRDTHLRSFNLTSYYQQHQQRQQPHWGERWLGIACALQARINSNDVNDYLDGKPFKPGTEPCHSLKKVSKKEEKSKKPNSGSSCLCPFFATCPSQQIYRDMPFARVWITTPGAMSMASLPRHLELRPIKLGELINEQSDIVVFDEVDTIINWFDNIYASEVLLTGGGIFDEIGIKTEQFTAKNRRQLPLMQRWISAERHAQTIVTATLTLLDRSLGHQFLADWIERGYFTPNSLFYKFSRRLAGFEEYENSENTTEQQRKKNKTQVGNIMQYFDALLDDDSLKIQNHSNTKVQKLSEIIQRISGIGESATDESIHNACKSWIIECFPDTKKLLTQLRQQLEIRQQNLHQKSKKKGRTQNKNLADSVDTIETLAYRLQFALTITLLDRHTRIVFYEWHNRPHNMSDEPPFRRMPNAMLNILPLPLTGRQFGTYYSRKDDNFTQSENSSENALSLFAYTNIGREYILKFHRLLTDLTGLRGPNVLALSGTSYLPDSTRFHVSSPQGVLTAELSASKAISKSNFKFLPQFNQQNEPIRISGTKEHKKQARFKEIAQALVGNNGTGHLAQELDKIKNQGQTNPDLWEDRERLLLFVNSYKQAKWVADKIRSYWLDIREQVYHLQPNITDNSSDKDLNNYPEAEFGGIFRADIETFASTNGKILVAPMSAIGRGFNILNQNGKAAFGAVYFLTRPYPHPHDTQAIAQEMNRRSLDWVDDADFVAWQEDGVLQRAETVRKLAANYWRSVEHRSYYKTLRKNEELRAFPRKDLAATTAGLIIQAVGRLLRGGVPFNAYFVDAAWAPNNALKNEADTPSSSLLAAIIELITEYVENDSISQALYKSITNALVDIENFDWNLD
ncbi:MAG: hypothetical protein WBA41_20560 [Rivularia sp. (in: cyanobacteria)]